MPDYEYRMVELPQTITTKRRTGSDAATELAQLVNREATNGWEFYRIDSFSVVVQPGCMGALGGHKPEREAVHLATFRRPR